MSPRRGPLLGNFRDRPGRPTGVTSPFADRATGATVAAPLRLRSRAAVALTGALAGVLVLTACGGDGEPNNPAGVTIETFDDDDGFHGAAMDPPYEVPEVTLEDTAGRTVSLSDVMSPVTVVFFGYTNCPDVCSMQMADAASAMRRMDETARADVSVVFITTDPQRDDAAALTKYLDRFDEFDSFVGLTGEMDQITEAAEALGVALTGTTDLPDGGYEVGHGSQLIGFGRDGTGQVIWTVGTSVGDLREDITTLALES